MNWIHLLGMILFWFAIGLWIFGGIVLTWCEITDEKRNGNNSLDDLHGGEL